VFKVCCTAVTLNVPYDIKYLKANRFQSGNTFLTAAGNFGCPGAKKAPSLGPVCRQFGRFGASVANCSSCGRAGKLLWALA
jgi:hypothetical protein